MRFVGTRRLDFNKARYYCHMDPAPHLYYVVLCTCPDAELAGRLAAALVEEHHAACVNILPGVQSVYRWQGKLASDKEVLLVIKTTGDCLPGVERCIRTLHSYQVPEMIALPISHGHAPYLNWITESLQP